MNEIYESNYLAQTRQAGCSNLQLPPEVKKLMINEQKLTINEQLMEMRIGMRDLLQKLHGISERAGTNLENLPTNAKECKDAPDSNTMCNVVADINDGLQRAHIVVSEIQSIV